MTKNKENKKLSRSSLGKRNRRKGQDLERLVVRDLKDLGYQFSKTARAGSKIMDDCGIDVIDGPPFLIQCKAGYEKNRPKFELLAHKTVGLLKDNYPADKIEHSYPFLLVHKLNGKHEYNFQVTMTWKTFLSELKQKQKYLEDLKKLSKYCNLENLPNELRYIHDL